MQWLIGGITAALVTFAAVLGGIGTGAILLAAIVWLLVAFRPVEAGVLVADWSRRRFE